MSIDVKLVRIFIASPNDVPKERDAIEAVIARWNRVHGVGMRIQFLPLRWEHATPEYGEHPQAVVNRTQVDESDALIGIFHTRLGSETLEAKSGTVEEIDRCHASGKSCKVYFCTAAPQADLADDALQAEYRRLQDYKQEILDKGLHGGYEHIEQLREKFSADLSAWARRFIDDDMAAQNARERALTVVASAIPSPVEHAIAGPSTLLEILPESRETGAARIFDKHADTYLSLISSPGFESSEVPEIVDAIEESCTPLLKDIIYIGQNDREARLYPPLMSLFETLTIHPTQSGYVWKSAIRRYGALLAFTALGLAQLTSGSMNLIRQLAVTQILDNQRWQGGKPQPMLRFLGYHEVFSDRTEELISAASARKRTPVSDHLLERLPKLFSGRTGQQFELYFDLWEFLWALLGFQLGLGFQFKCRIFWNSKNRCQIAHLIQSAAKSAPLASVPAAILSFFGGTSGLHEAARRFDELFAGERFWRDAFASRMPPLVPVVEGEEIPREWGSHY